MYYHVSPRNDPFEIGESKRFTPRVPINGYLDDTGCVIEDTITPRVCLAPTIFGCLVASHFDEDLTHLHMDYLSGITIYATHKIPNILVPRMIVKNIPKHYKNIVPDSHLTHEVWSLDPIELMVINKFDWANIEITKAMEHKSLLLSIWKDEYNKRMPKKYRV